MNCTYRSRLSKETQKRKIIYNYYTSQEKKSAYINTNTHTYTIITNCFKANSDELNRIPEKCNLTVIHSELVLHTSMLSCFRLQSRDLWFYFNDVC